MSSFFRSTVMEGVLKFKSKSRDLTKGAWLGSRDLTASSTYLFGFASLIIGFKLSMFSFASYFAFNIWLGMELPISAVNFGVLGVKIGEGIFGFRPQPNQFF